MPDVGKPLAGEHGVTIATALRTLPLEAPPRSAWPVVAPVTRVVHRRAHRWPYALATAAALALALLLPVPTERSDGGDDPMLASLELPALMQESARLERLIAAVNDDPLQPADALVLGLAFEDDLAGIDAELATTPRGSRDAQDLWQQRVDILSRYAQLQSSRRLLASAGQPYETTLVALH